jgi:serine/threonine protein kinase
MPQSPLTSEQAASQPVVLIGAESDLSTTKQHAAESRSAAVPATASWSGQPPDCPVDVGSGSEETAGDERYDLLHHLGSGGFGTVHLAWDRLLHREVAIKRPKAKLPAEFEQVFIHEARTAAGLRHPGIVTVFDVGIDSRGLFIIYEHVTGGSLKSRLRGEPWPLNEALELTLAIVEALAEAHRKGLTHRDLKPANILLNAAGRPQIADFGLALAHDEQAAHEGEIAGTEKYMAPEQVRGDAHQVDGRTDLWAVGVILYELLTGHLPFVGRSSDELRSQILGADPRPPRQWNGAIPASVEQLVFRLLAKPQGCRPSSAAELTEELRSLLHPPKRLEPLAPATSVPTPALRSSNSMALMVIALVSIVAMLSVVGGLYLAGADRRQLSPPAGQFPVGTWKELLDEMPRAIVNAETEPQFEPGQLTVTSKFPTLFELGEAPPANYSIRLKVAPAAWDGDAGVFLNFGSSLEQPAEDECLLIGVVARGEGKLTLNFRQWLQSRDSRQLPKFQLQYSEPASEIPVPASGEVSLQIDVAEGRVRAVALSGNTIDLPPDLRAANSRRNGKFGIYLLRGSSRFSHPLIRVATQE